MFREEIFKYFRERGETIDRRITRWLEVSNENGLSEFPLIEASRSFRITLADLLEAFRKQLEAFHKTPDPTHSI